MPLQYKSEVKMKNQNSMGDETHPTTLQVTLCVYFGSLGVIFATG